MGVLPCEDMVHEQQSRSGAESASHYRWVILGLAFGSQWSATLAAQVVPPLAPILQSELGLSKVEIGIFSSAAFIGSWGVLVVAGYLTERFGIRVMMTLGQVVAGGFMATMFMAGSFLQATLVMLVVGTFRAMVHPGASAAIMDWFPAKERGTAMGITQTGYPIAGIAMALALPALALTIGWRYSTSLVGLVIVTVGVITMFSYRDPPKQMRTAKRGISMRAALRELLKKRKLWVLSGTALSYATAQLAMVSYFALYLSDIILPATFPDERVRVIVAGGFLALLQVGAVVGRVFWGIVSDRLFPTRRLSLIAVTGGLAGLIGLAIAYLSVGLPLWLLMIVVFAYGLTALGWPGLNQALIVETAGRTHAAIAVGLCMTVSQLGTVCGPPVFGFIVQQTGSYQPAWVLISCLCFAGATSAALYSRREGGGSRREASVRTMAE